MGTNRRLDSNLTPVLAAITANTIFAAVDGAAFPRTSYQVPASVFDARWLRTSQNLADLNNAGTARTNLGLGSAAVANVGDFATAAQGALAASALQPAAIGVLLQAYNGNLADIAALAPGAPEDGYAITWDNGASAFVLASLASLLPVEETTPIVYQTGDVTRTATFDLSALTAARSYVLPNVGTTLAGLGVAQTFTATQKINVNSSDALIVEQSGVFDNLFKVRTDTGRIAILKSIPSATLDVNGSILASSSIQSTAEIRGGRIRGNVGSEGFPTYATDADSNTGLHLAGADILQLVTNSTRRLRIRADGTVGIGEDNATALLHVTNTALRPVAQFTQSDISEEIIWLEGESDAGNADMSLVDAGDFTTPGAILGWFKVKVEDNRVGGIGTVDGWIEVKAIPTA